MGIVFRWLFSGVWVVLFAGCALQADLVDMERVLKGTQEEQLRLKELIEGPDQTDGSTAAEAARQSLGELVIRGDELSAELQAIRGQMEQDSHMLSLLLQKLDDQK